MEIRVIHGDQVHSFPGDAGFPLRLPTERLTVAVDATGVGQEILDQEEIGHTVEECGLTFQLGLPGCMKLHETGVQSEYSHARYLVEGDLDIRGQNLGVLLQVLPAGRETSCHSHPSTRENPLGTTEFFLPILREGWPTAFLHTLDGKQSILPEGSRVAPGVPHQLQAPPNHPTVTLIFMWPIPYATWMDGHVPHNPPFVPYTGPEVQDFLETHLGKDSKGRRILEKPARSGRDIPGSRAYRDT